MRLLTVSNLYPRPDQPQRGMFNAQLFGAFAGTESVENVCLVPEWRVWRWPAIRRWESPVRCGPPTRYVPVFYLPAVGRNFSHRTYAASMAPVRGASRGSDATYVAWVYPDGAAVARVLPPDRPLWLMVLGSDTFHLDHPRRRAALIAACSRAEGVVCVCRSLAERLLAAGVAAERVHVVPNGVDTAKFHPISRREALDRLRESGSLASHRVTQSPRLVLFVGNMVRVKGPDIMLRSWAAFVGSQRADTPTLVFIGDGPMREELGRLARELGVADSVSFAGARPHDELPLWMNAAAGLCLTSRSEGMPNVVIEALAVGLPVVAADVGACREMLSGRDGTWVVPPDDTAAVASALRAALAFRPNARRSTEMSRAWQDQAREILELVQREEQAGERITTG